MEYRLYCELKANDKKSGKLLAVTAGVYYVDDEDIKHVLRAPFSETASVIDRVRHDIKEWLKEDLSENVRNADVVYDFDITYLDDEFFDDEEEVSE